MRVYLKDKDGGWVLYTENLDREFKQRGIVIGKGVKIEDNAWIGNDVKIADHVIIMEHSRVLARSEIGQNVVIGAMTVIHEGVEIYPYAVIGNGATINMDAVIDRQVRIGERVSIGKRTKIESFVGRIFSGAIIGNDVTIHSAYDYVVIGPLGTREAMLTGYKRKGKLMVATGCFNGTAGKFEERVKATHRFNLRHKAEYLHALAYLKAKFGVK